MAISTAKNTISHHETPMDRLRHEHHLLAEPFAQPNRDLVTVDTDPWDFAAAQAGAALDKSTDESAGIDPDVSLDEIIRSSVVVNVLEAVAIVQKICWISHDPPAVLFDLETLAIRASGDVVVLGRPIATTQPPMAIQSVGKVLRELISRTSAPPQLQEIVAAAMTDAERFRSFTELANALRAYQSPNGAELIRGVYLRWRNGVTSSSDDAKAQASSKRLKVLARIWARVQSRLPRDRRVAAGLALCVVAGALLIALSRFDFARSTTSASGATSNTAVQTLASAFTGALNWIGLGSPVTPVASDDVASVARKKVSNARPKKSGTTGPKDSLRGLQLAPLVNTATVQENAPAPIGNADVDATRETSSEDARPQDDSPVDPSIIYSPNDADVIPPVAIRSPGPATGRGYQDRNAALIQILVNEAGLVESAQVLRAPATMGEALRSTMALSVVKTWSFAPARKNGQPVKYRTTVPFIETGMPSGTVDERLKPR